MLRVQREGRLYHKPSLVHYYAAWLYGKGVGEVTREEYEAAKKQLLTIIRKYWNNPGVRESRIAEILAASELKEMYNRFPQAPRSYIVFYKLMREGEQ